MIALVVTIIVLLILAGVSIIMLTGKNNILEQAQNANQETDIKGTREQIELELVSRYDDEGNYTNEDVIEAVYDVTGTTVDEEAGTVKTAKGNEVDISDLWKEIIEKISTTDSYVGYYADVDGDGVVDGLIFADLAFDGSGVWNGDDWSSYEYTAKSDLKSYYISRTGYSDDFGPHDVISCVEGSSGEDRFYVMALDNFAHDSDSWFYWYADADDNLDSNDIVAEDYNDFGQGKANTIKVMDYWNKETCGTKTTSESGKSCIDLWGAIQDGQYKIITSEVDGGKWFVPSRAEWSAFGDWLFTELGVSAIHESDFGLSDLYWASAQYAIRNAYVANLSIGCVGQSTINCECQVRLCTSF